VNDPNWISDFFHIERGTMLAAGLGAVISLGFIGKSRPLLWRWFLACGGFIVAVYSTPFVMDFYGFNAKVEGGVGLTLGLFSMSVIDAVFTAIKTANLGERIMKRIGL